MTALRPTADDIAAARRLLGVGNRPSREEIMAAWKRRLRETHPDVASDEMRAQAEDISKDVNVAKDTLLRALDAGWVPYSPMPPPPGTGAGSAGGSGAATRTTTSTAGAYGPRPVSRQTASTPPRQRVVYEPEKLTPLPKMLTHPAMLGLGFIALFSVILILVGFAAGGGDPRGESRIEASSTTTTTTPTSESGEIPSGGPVPTTPTAPATIDDSATGPPTSAGAATPPQSSPTGGTGTPSSGGATRPVPGGVEVVPLPADTPEQAVKLLLFSGTTGSYEVLNGIADRNVRGTDLGRIVDAMNLAGRNGTISAAANAVFCRPVLGLERATCTAGNVFEPALDVRRTDEGWRIAGFAT